MYWDILYDCAKHIRLNLDEYSIGYVPANPFDEEDGDLPMEGKITPFPSGKNEEVGRTEITATCNILDISSNVTYMSLAIPPAWWYYRTRTNVRTLGGAFLFMANQCRLWYAITRKCIMIGGGFFVFKYRRIHLPEEARAQLHAPGAGKHAIHLFNLSGRHRAR